MTIGTKEILDRQSDLEGKRRLEEPSWRELAMLLRPDENDFDNNEHHRRDQDDASLYDATPLYALDTFVGGMFGQSVNPATRWFELGSEDPDLDKWQPARRWFYGVTNLLYSSLSPQVSNFYARAPAWLANLGAFGFGDFYQEEDVGAGRIVDCALPVGQVYLDRNAFGDYDVHHRKWRFTGRQFQQKFGARARIDDKKSYEIVHAVFPNPEFRAGAAGPRGMPFASVYCSPDNDLKDWRQDGGYFEFPFHIPTWNERAHTPYPTGPGHNQRADAQTLQEMERAFLVRANYDAEPMLLLENEEVMRASDLYPNALLYGTMSDQGKAKAQYLEKRGNMSLALQQSEQRRNAIRAAFYFGLMQVALQRPQMTATEFLGLQEETLKLMAPNLVRVQTGGLSTFITRRFRILDRAQQIPPPPPEIMRSRVTISYVSPLAKVQMLAEGRGVLQFQQAVEQMAVTDPAARDWFNGDAAAPVVAKAFSAVPSILRDPKDVAAIRQQRAQLQAQQQQIADAGAMVSIAAEAAHADQAGTLAKQRKPAA